MYIGLISLLDNAAEDLTGVADEGVTWRLSQAAEAADSANRSTMDELAAETLAPDKVLVF